jgi:hypothetical protein
MICKQTTLQNCCLRMMTARKGKLNKFSLWSCSSKTKFKDFLPTLLSSKDLRDEDKQSSNFLTKLPPSSTVFLTLNLTTLTNAHLQCTNTYFAFKNAKVHKFVRSQCEMRGVKSVLAWACVHVCLHVSRCIACVTELMTSNIIQGDEEIIYINLYVHYYRYGYLELYLCKVQQD